jgi:hypothetical protein
VRGLVLARGQVLEQGAMTATQIVNELKGVNRVMYDVREQAAGHDRVEVMISTCYLLLWLVPTVVV